MIIRTMVKNLLLAFVWITLGFSMGRHSVPRTMLSAINPADAGSMAPAPAGQVTVYAAHMTFRCPECTQIEWFARELVENEFSAELADGRLVFRTVDYMRDTAFARKYNISSSTIVVVRLQDGEAKDFQRLDEVWTKLRDKDAYFEYVRTAIQDSLETAVPAVGHPAGTASNQRIALDPCMRGEDCA